METKVEKPAKNLKIDQILEYDVPVESLNYQEHR